MGSSQDRRNKKTEEIRLIVAWRNYLIFIGEIAKKASDIIKKR